MKHTVYATYLTLSLVGVFLLKHHIYSSIMYEKRDKPRMKKKVKGSSIYPTPTTTGAQVGDFKDIGLSSLVFKGLKNLVIFIGRRKY